MSRNISKEIEYSKLSPWNKFQTTFDSADFVFGNLEGAIPLDSCNDEIGKSLFFDIKKSYIKFISEAGFSAFSIENNHSNDFGYASKMHTFKFLKESGIEPVSYEDSPHFFVLGNNTISIITINQIKDKLGKYTECPSIQLFQKLRLAKSFSNLVIVVIHWGTELHEWPNSDQRRTADWLTKNGADVIIGTHPHVIQNVELVNNKPVFFSLGNHVFDQKYLPTKKGLIADLRIINNHLICKGLITNNINNSLFSQISTDTTYNFNDIELHNSSLIYNNEEFILSSGQNDSMGSYNISFIENNKLIWKEQPMPISHIDFLKIEENTKCLFMLKKYYSSIDKSFELRPYVYSYSTKGLLAKWRGSALAWPLIDAHVMHKHIGVICALHRGDSFISPNPKTKKTRTASYKWNGFGFTMINDSLICKECEDYYKEIVLSHN